MQRLSSLCNRLSSLQRSGSFLLNPALLGTWRDTAPRALLPRACPCATAAVMSVLITMKTSKANWMTLRCSFVIFTCIWKQWEIVVRNYLRKEGKAAIFYPVSQKSHRKPLQFCLMRQFVRLRFLFLSFSFFLLLMFIVRRERCVLCGFVMQEEQ